MISTAPDTPLTVAVVGSGPSGFYAAGALLDRADRDVRVDMFERLATPWGLVRSGVAPDHPKIKQVSSVYAGTAAHESFRFFGNIELGRHVTAAELVERYDAVIYAVGASGDRALGVPGEDLPGSVPAVDFVGWYNGHPDYADHDFDLDTDRAVVIGNGNVALDVARILGSPPERLARTDIADHALDVLRGSRISEVVVIGRRGPAEAAFTTPELKELPEFTGAGVAVEPTELHRTDDEEVLSRAVRRNLAVLRGYAAAPPDPGTRHLALRFRRSPVELTGRDRVEGVTLAVNELRTGPDGRVGAHDTGAREHLAAGLVLRAVGYRGRALPGVPFDERGGVIPHERGRVLGRDREYVVGWIKRGPTGIIGTNRKDAGETVGELLADLDSGRLRRHERDATLDIGDWLARRQPDLVTEDEWRLIDAAERAAGEPHGRPRVKLRRLHEMLEIARSRSGSSR